MLKRYKADREDPKRNKVTSQPFSANTTFRRDIGNILSHKFIDRGGYHNVYKHINFLIRWEGDSPEAITWHPEKDMCQFEDHITKYLATLSTRMLDSLRGGECHKGSNGTRPPQGARNARNKANGCGKRGTTGVHNMASMCDVVGAHDTMGMCNIAGALNTAGAHGTRLK